MMEAVDAGFAAGAEEGWRFASFLPDYLAEAIFARADLMKRLVTWTRLKSFEELSSREKEMCFQSFRRQSEIPLGCYLPVQSAYCSFMASLSQLSGQGSESRGPLCTLSRNSCRMRI